MTAKQQFFDQVLGGLKERSAYFSRDIIQAAADEDHGAEFQALAALYEENVNLGFPGIVGALGGPVRHVEVGDTERLELVGDAFAVIRVHAVHGDVAEEVPALVPGLEAAGGVGDFVADAVELQESRAGEGHAAALGVDHRDMVVVHRFRVHELAGEVAGELEDLAGVAVVEAEDGGSSGGLDAHAGEAEVEAPRFPVDRLGIVVEEKE